MATRRVGSALLVVLLSVSLSLITFQPASANGTIYIRSDGSVEGTDKIQRSGDLYTFTDHINGSIIVERNDIVISGNHYTLQSLHDGSSGFRLEQRTNVTIERVNIEEFNVGVYINLSSGIVVSENKMSDNWMYDTCIHLINSSNCRILSNRILYGSIILSACSGNDLINNTVSPSVSYGMCLYNSSKNLIWGNTIRGVVGLFMDYMDGFSIDNFVHHNNIWCSQQHAYSGGRNVWDDGYPSGGNYWSDYSGNDSYCGPEQNQPGSDGIGDTAYLIAVNNSDRYPLMYPFSSDEWWRNSIVPGDLLLCSSPGSAVLAVSEWTHAGMYVGQREGYGGEWVVEALKSGGVQYTPITSWDYPDKVAVEIRRVFSGLGEAYDNAFRAGAIQFAEWQVGKDYSLLHLTPHYNNDSDSWYCTELVWASYLNSFYPNQGINIDGPQDSVGWITPDSIHSDDNTTFVDGHFERFPSEIRDEFLHNGFIAEAHSPIDLNVTDPTGIAFNNETSENNGGAYVYYDVDKDGEVELIVSVPQRRVGTYEVRVIPKSDAGFADVYSLDIWTRDTRIRVADGVPLGEAPAQPYVIESETEGITQVAIFKATWDTIDYPVLIRTNSSIAHFSFKQQEAMIHFEVSGDNGTNGHCNVTIPKTLLSASTWAVRIDGVKSSFASTESDELSHVYFSYSHSNHTVEIVGTQSIPEFPSLPFILAFMTGLVALSSLFTIALVNSQHRRKLSPLC